MGVTVWTGETKRIYRTKRQFGTGLLEHVKENFGVILVEVWQILLAYGILVIILCGSSKETLIAGSISLEFHKNQF